MLSLFEIVFLIGLWLEHRATHHTSLQSTSSTDSASLILLQDVVFGHVRSSAEKKKEDSLSEETALDDGQRWENDRFWEEYAQLLIEKDDIQSVLEEET